MGESTPDSTIPSTTSLMMVPTTQQLFDVGQFLIAEAKTSESREAYLKAEQRLWDCANLALDSGDRVLAARAKVEIATMVYDALVQSVDSIPGYWSFGHAIELSKSAAHLSKGLSAETEKLAVHRLARLYYYRDEPGDMELAARTYFDFVERLQNNQVGLLADKPTPELRAFVYRNAFSIVRASGDYDTAARILGYSLEMLKPEATPSPVLANLLRTQAQFFLHNAQYNRALTAIDASIDVWTALLSTSELALSERSKFELKLQDGLILKRNIRVYQLDSMSLNSRLSGSELKVLAELSSQLGDELPVDVSVVRNGKWSIDLSVDQLDSQIANLKLLRLNEVAGGSGLETEIVIEQAARYATAIEKVIDFSLAQETKRYTACTLPRSIANTQARINFASMIQGFDIEQVQDFLFSYYAELAHRAALQKDTTVLKAQLQKLRVFKCSIHEQDAIHKQGVQLLKEFASENELVIEE